MIEVPSSKRYTPVLIDLNNKNTSHSLVISLIGENKRILEIGTSTGYMSKLLEERGNSVIGIEVDPDAAEIAKQSCELMIIGDIESLDLDNYLESASIDVVVCADVLEHLKYPGIVIQKIRKYLKPDGYLVVSLPNMCHGDILLSLICGDFKYTSTGLLDETHLRFFGLKNIVQLFNKCGYYITDLHTTTQYVGGTELEINKGKIPGPLFEFIKCLPDASVYQYVFKAILSHKTNEEIVFEANLNTIFDKSIEETVKEHNEQLVQKISEYEDKISSLVKKTSEYENEISVLNNQITQESIKSKELEQEIAEIRRGIIFQTMTKFHKGFIEPVFPFGTGRRRIYDRCLTGGRILANEGLKEFSRKSHNYSLDGQNRLKVSTLSNARKIFKSMPLNVQDNASKVLNGVRYQKSKLTEENKNIVVSVVIPIYDRTIELQESIESILNQSFKDFELILVTDGSPEETLKIVDSYQNHPNVRIFKYYNNSGNAVRGRNKGIKEAFGKYIAFQDSDDIAHKDRLKQSVEAIEKADADIVYGGYELLIDGSRKDLSDLKNGQIVFSEECDLEKLKNINVICQSTVMCKTEALRKVGGLKQKMGYREDHELWLRLAYNGYKFKCIDKVLCKLRLHKNNLEIKHKKDDDQWLALTQEEYKILTRLPPKLAYVVPGLGIGGGIAVALEHCNRLKKRGYDVIIVTLDEHVTQVNWFPNNIVEIYPLSKIPQNIDILVATEWRTVFVIDKLKSDRKFYFVQSDESRFYDDNYTKQKVLSTYKYNFEYITEAKWIQKWLKENFGHSATYVPNALNPNNFFKTTPLEPKSDKIRILLEGPIDIKFKGMEDAFKAISDLNCEVWCISSSGKPKNGWRCDRFFEKIPFEDMKYIYSSCDILLKMSRVEGFFGPPMEMMACGGCCVVSKVTGYDEYIKDEYNALVVEQEDIEGAKNAVSRLIEDKVLREEIIRNSYETAKSWSDWEKSIDTLEKLYFSNLAQ